MTRNSLGVPRVPPSKVTYALSVSIVIALIQPLLSWSQPIAPAQRPSVVAPTPIPATAPAVNSAEAHTAPATNPPTSIVTAASTPAAVSPTVVDTSRPGETTQSPPVGVQILKIVIW